VPPQVIAILLYYWCKKIIYWKKTVFFENFLFDPRITFYGPKIGLKIVFSGSPIWDPNLGYPIWDPNLDHKYGPPFWTPNMDPLFNSTTLLIALQPKIDVHPISTPNLGPQFGTPNMDPHFGPPIWTPYSIALHFYSTVAKN
jgi:hypothetical protein